MSDIDFKVENYSIEDLLEIFGITNALPQNEIIERGSGMIEKYRQQNKPNYVRFFSNATNKLLSNYREVEEYFGNISDSEDEREGFIGNRLPNTSNPQPNTLLPAEDVWQHNQTGSLANHYEGRRHLTHVPTNLDHVVQLRRNLTLPNGYAQVPFAQGTMNPTLQNVYLTWVNVDSQFRDIVSTAHQSTSCATTPAGPITAVKSIQQGNATDFIFTLNEPITNVLSMSLGSLELPLKGYYVFSNSKGNTTFDIKFTWGDIGYLQNNEEFVGRLDKYIYRENQQNQVYYRIGNAGDYNPCIPPVSGVCEAYAVPCTTTIDPNAPKNTCNEGKWGQCDDIDGQTAACPPFFKPPKNVKIPPYNGPWNGSPTYLEELIEQWGNFGYFTSTDDVNNLVVPLQPNQFHCTRLPQGNYQNSVTTQAQKLEDYLTLAIQGVVGPQARPSNPILTNIWTPPQTKEKPLTFLKSFISKGSGKPFFSINGTFDWWVNQTLPLCVPTSTFLRAPRIGMNPPGFGGGFWSPWMQGNKTNVVSGVGKNYYTLGTPVPCDFTERMTALTPKEIWARVGKQYTGGQINGGEAQSCSSSNSACISPPPSFQTSNVEFDMTPESEPKISAENTPPASIGFNLLDMDIFGRFIYCWNEIVCNWAHTNVYDLFVLGPTRWRKIDPQRDGGTPIPTETLVFGGTNNSYMEDRKPWTFAKKEAWEATNYIDQLPLTFEQFLSMQPGYEKIQIASKSGGVGYWNVSSNKSQQNTIENRPAMYNQADQIVWPYIENRPIDGGSSSPEPEPELESEPELKTATSSSSSSSNDANSPSLKQGWQQGLDTVVTEGYWHNKDNFNPQDLSWQQQCTNAGGWFGVGGEIPYPATTYVRGCASTVESRSCVLTCNNNMSGLRDDRHFPLPYGPSYYALDPSVSNEGQGCSTVGASNQANAGGNGTLSAAFAHCQGPTWANNCSDTNCCHPQGKTGGIWCAQSAVGSGLPAKPQTEVEHEPDYSLRRLE